MGKQSRIAAIVAVAFTTMETLALWDWGCDTPLQRQSRVDLLFSFGFQCLVVGQALFDTVGRIGRRLGILTEAKLLEVRGEGSDPTEPPAREPVRTMVLIWFLFGGMIFYLTHLVKSWCIDETFPS